MFRVIADDLRARIESGELPAGKPLGTEKILAQHYDAGLWAIGAAVELLRQQGYVEPARPGRVAIVREQPPMTEVTGRRGSRVIGRPATQADVDAAPASEGVSLDVQVFVVQFGVDTFVYRQDSNALNFS